MSDGILDRLAELELTIPGINAAYADVPNNVLSDTELPCFLNMAGPASYRRVNDSQYEEDGQYTALLLVQKAITGVPGEASTAIRPWRDTVRDFFMARPTLDGHRYTMYYPEGGLQGAGQPGQVPVPRWGVIYLGCEFTFRFVELLPLDLEE